jgi:hypothetical protein
MRPLDTLDKSVLTLAAIMAAIILYFVIGYWLARQIPRRPKAVSANAVFLWAPHVGLPGPRRGWWLVCWPSEARNRCRKSDIDGRTLFEGDFTPYRRKTALGAEELRIVANKTQDARQFWLENTWVPMVYLENGEVLIPVARYEEGKGILDQRKSSP